MLKVIPKEVVKAGSKVSTLLGADGNPDSLKAYQVKEVLSDEQMAVLVKYWEAWRIYGENMICTVIQDAFKLGVAIGRQGAAGKSDHFSQ